MTQIKLFLFTLLVSLSNVIFAQTATPPSLGDGTEGNPYQINTLDNLYWLSVNFNEWGSGKFFIQTSDIYASSTATWDDGNNGDAEGFSPIGTYATPFLGSYNGNSFIISHLKINRPNTNYCGLFGYIDDNAIIQKLGLTEFTIIGQDYTGAIVGFNDNSLITNCYSSGSVTGRNFVGGFVGYLFFGSSGSITNSYSHGSVSGGSYVAGLIGYTYRNISNCYSNCSVSGTGVLKGLIGHTNTNYSPIISNCFWDIETSGQETSSNGTGKTTIEMKTLSTFTDATWDFLNETTNGTDDIWNIDESKNNGYPYLSWQKFTTISIKAIENNFAKIYSYANVIYINLAYAEKSLVTVFDISGHKVKELNSSAQAIQINELSEGVYIVKLSAENINKITKVYIK